VGLAERRGHQQHSKRLGHCYRTELTNNRSTMRRAERSKCRARSQRDFSRLNRARVVRVAAREEHHSRKYRDRSPRR